MKNRLFNENNLGFTLIEICIVLCILGLLTTMGLRSMVKARHEANATVCSRNLAKIDTAKQEWAFEYRKGDDAVPTEEDLSPYLGNEFPTCPEGGIKYIIGSVGTLPTCQNAGSYNGHKLQ